MSSEIWTKNGSGAAYSANGGVANEIAGDVAIEDHMGRKFILRPTFEAALEIESALGSGLEGFRARVATAGLPNMPAPTLREYGVLLAAGVRAAGDPRANVEAATRLAYDIGKSRLRQPMTDFLYALTDGGRPREEDLKKRGSSTDSDDADPSTVSDLIDSLSAGTSGSPS